MHWKLLRARRGGPTLLLPREFVLTASLAAADPAAAAAANEVEQSIAMNDTSNTAAGLDQADEEILTYTASDEALEAAAGIERGADASYYPPQTQPCLLQCLVWRD
jgi:hypothetical protein